MLLSIILHAMVYYAILMKDGGLKAPVFTTAVDSCIF